MRAGGFAEDRVIDLVNRRFVPFYFNRGGPGSGHDAKALAFVNGQTTNQFAYLAAFSPEGKMLGETELYADKDAVAEFLVRMLKENPGFAKPTKEEAKNTANPEDPSEWIEPGPCLIRALLLEELAEYELAERAYKLALGDWEESKPEMQMEALFGLMRISRYQEYWGEHETHETLVRSGHDENSLIHADMEAGYRLIAQKKYAEARKLLQPLTKRATNSKRLAEAHFYAGVACWFLNDRDWAKFHWIWIMENMPEDRLYSRARIAAAAEGMPYENPELGGFKADVGNIGPHDIVSAISASEVVFESLLPAWQDGQFEAKREIIEPAPDDPVALIAALRDGNAFVPANNKIVTQLKAIGEPAIAPLMASIENPLSKGRGYSGWALGQVLKDLDERPAEAMALLQKIASSDPDEYVQVLTQSGLNTIHAANRARPSTTGASAT